MAARAYWQGKIRLALVSIPVENHSAIRAAAPQPAGGSMIDLMAAFRKSVGGIRSRTASAAQRKRKSP